MVQGAGPDLSRGAGQQLLFQFPNNKLLTTKIGLLSALREYARVSGKIHQPAPCLQAK